MRGGAIRAYAGRQPGVNWRGERNTAMTPIQLHTWATPNGHKASIMLEETGLPYTAHAVDIEHGAQQTPAFLALNPNNKIPVLHDPDRGRTVVESGAILLYLAERAGRLQPSVGDDTLSWLFFQAAHVGPTLGQLWNFKVFASEKLPSVVERFEREAARILGVLEGELARHEFIGADRYGVADIMHFPWLRAAQGPLGLNLEGRPNLARWYAAVEARPAVRRGLAVPAMEAGS